MALRCGVAGADITPGPGPVLQGHWSTNPSRSVLYPLEARAVVFEVGDRRVAVAALDLIGVTKELTDRIRDRVDSACGIPGNNVMVACSHTHCGPATLPCLGQIPEEPLLKRIEEEAAGCIVRAAGELQPVHVGIGCGSVHFNLNRRSQPEQERLGLNYGGVVDRRARVLRVDREDATPLAIIFHYSCHPTTKSGSEGDISPDYPGIARKRVEDTLGCAALFLQGCCGNVRPEILTEKGLFTSASVTQLDACGEELGGEICRVAGSIRTRPTSGLQATRMDIEMPFGPVDSEEDLERRAAETSLMGRLLTGPWARGVLEMVREGRVPDGRPSEMQWLRVGPLGWVSTPGETVQEIGHAIEKRYRESAGVEDLWPVAYANDEIGYLCTERHHHEGGYEPNAYPYYGEPAPYRNEERVILETAGALLRA